MAFARKRTSDIQSSSSETTVAVADFSVGDATSKLELASAVLQDASKRWHSLKIEIRSRLADVFEVEQLSALDRKKGVQELLSVVSALVPDGYGPIPDHKLVQLCQELLDDITGLGPLEALVARDDIADIMVNGMDDVFIEVGGRVEKTPIKFGSNEQLLEICQRIVRQVGRRVDETSPICDARLIDGSRVNVIIPPLAIDGPTLTIRKFKKDKLKLSNLVEFGSITAPGARLLEIIGNVRCNILISGGTGSGKTTLLNCMTAFVNPSERVVTCEDAAELQLQQSHVVRLETRPANLEGAGEITMADLVKNCLRMRPDRIIVGEVRGGEAFDLLQAMNTGHDGSMGTLHANSPREAISRLEAMIMASKAGQNLPMAAIRETITSSVDVIIQAERIRDGRRVITAVTEVVGQEEGTIVLQDLLKFNIEGADDDGRVIGSHIGTGVMAPMLEERAAGYGRIVELKEIMQDINGV